MTDEHSPTDYRGEIDRRLESTLQTANAARIPVARATADEDEDRWYGRLLVHSYDSVTGSVGSEAALSAAAAIELLRGYYRPRSELVAQVTADVAHSVTRDPTSTLLAGDYLHAAAYAELGDIDHASLGACFETLTDVSGQMVQAFAATATGSASSSENRPSLVDGTTGALGEGAAVIGATLAGVDDSHHEHFATLGRGLGAGRGIHRILESDPESPRIGSHGADERALREHADRCLSDAEGALRELSSVADVDRLRPLFEEIAGFDG